MQYSILKFVYVMLIAECCKLYT